MDQKIIHVDMDAFYASVEIRDDPGLKGRPLIIGALPRERGVVATCSYEARKYGVRSGMNIKEAYALCPTGVYKHPDFDRYRRVSCQLHDIWNDYADASETIALDEAYLDVTGRAASWDEARAFARRIKERTRDETGLSCSVGLAYSKSAAKTASEEKKPDGYFEILTPAAFMDLLSDRDVGVLYTVGEKTAGKLRRSGILKVRDIREDPERVISLLGSQGRWLVSLSFGEDDRRVSPYRPEEAKSISREVTFQQDVASREFLSDALLLLALSVERRAARVGLWGEGVTLKVTWPDMKSATRSRLIPTTRSAAVIWEEAVRLLDTLPPGPVRLIGAGIYRLRNDHFRQLSFEDCLEGEDERREERIETALAALEKRYKLDFKSNLDRIFRGETLYRTLEYMRRHFSP
ncbi:MAG: DNA polymerase IV [Clostridia bacterium]|nr:DNA polymerase IV [Clostridia bacterium]